jgi:hypothetical protein
MERGTVKTIKRLESKPEFVYNLEIEDNHNYFIEGVLLHNSPNVILDEAALIEDDVEGKIFRMLGDSIDNFYFKIGNPFKRNHFLKDSQNPNFYKININYGVGIREGRLTQEFIEEAKKKPHFSILYENLFPAANAIDDSGYSFLINDLEYEKALDLILPEAYFGIKMLGVDVAGGGENYTVWVMRCGNYAKVLGKNKDPNTMSTVGQTIRLARENKIDMQNVFIDDTGIGHGVFDRLREQQFYVHSVTLGEHSSEKEKYANRRAENYWKMKEWINTGGKLCLTDDWEDIKNIKYKADSAGKLQIMPKLEMLTYGWESPDTIDALMLTFHSNPYVNEEEGEYKEEFNRFNII